jgi:hypothetical protein
MKAARDEKEQKKAAKAAIVSKKKPEIEQNCSKREEKLAGQAAEQE